MKSYSESVEFVGKFIANKEYDLFMSGAIDTRVFFSREKKLIAHIYNVDEHTVDQDINKNFKKFRKI